MSFPKKGPKDWSPLWLDQVMEELEQFTVDTDLKFKSMNNAKALLGVVDVTADGKLSAYHVTDDPEVSERAIKRGDLRSHDYHGPFCPGLYVSAFPKEWRGRSRKKWDFLSELSEDRMITLGSLLEDNLRHQKMSGYITQSEMDRGVEWIRAWIETVNPDILIELARQPYNIKIQEVAERNAIAEPWKPFVVQVVFEGRYLRFNQQVQEILPAVAAQHLKKQEKDVAMEDVCRTLIYYGWDGLFTRDAGNSRAELVIWNPEKILSYGLREGSPRLSGSLSGRGEGGTAHVGRRFETDLSPEGTVADLHEVANKTKMFSLLRLPAVLELMDMVEKLNLGLEPEQGRFKADLSTDNPAIIDTMVYRRFADLSKEDLGELVILLDDLVTRMEVVS